MFIKDYFYGLPFSVFSHVKVISLPCGDCVFCLQWHPRDSIRMYLHNHCPQKYHSIKYNLLSNKFLPAFKSKRGSMGITLYITSLNVLFFLRDRKITVKQGGRKAEKYSDSCWVNLKRSFLVSGLPASGHIFLCFSDQLVLLLLI